MGTHEPLAISLAQRLIQIPSVTPQDGEGLAYIAELLQGMGFRTTFWNFGEVKNLYARWGTASPHLCFAGHVDVVPPGDLASWTVDPFAGVIKDGQLWGRGAADMKGAIACFITAVQSFLEKNKPSGSISILLTSDEEGPAQDGIQRVIPCLQDQGEVIDLCLIGEPTGTHVGELIKIGRRGSMTGVITSIGKQGHIAYPEAADNPIPRLLSCLQELVNTPLDTGTPEFQPSNLEITSIDVGNPVTNIIPAQAMAHFGVRFNPLHTAHSLSPWITDVFNTHLGLHTLDLTTHGDAFITRDTNKINVVARAVEQVTGQRPALSTGGGTSDGRFLTKIAPVIECGLNQQTIHQVNERVEIAEIEILTKVYEAILKRFLCP